MEARRAAQRLWKRGGPRSGYGSDKQKIVIWKTLFWAGMMWLGARKGVFFLGSGGRDTSEVMGPQRSWDPRGHDTPEVMGPQRSRHPRGHGTPEVMGPQRSRHPR